MSSMASCEEEPRRGSVSSVMVFMAGMLMSLHVLAFVQAIDNRIARD